MGTTELERAAQASCALEPRESRRSLSYPADREEGGETKRVKDKASSLPARVGPGRGRYLHLQQDGAVRSTAHLLHLPRPVPNPETATMPTQLLSRPLHGRTGRHCGEQQRKHFSCRQRKPSDTDLLMKAPSNLYYVSIYLTNIIKSFL